MVLTESDIKKLKVAELKSELADRGLNQTGKKDELAQRLIDFIASNNTESVVDSTDVEPKPVVETVPKSPVKNIQQSPKSPIKNPIEQNINTIVQDKPVEQNPDKTIIKADKQTAVKSHKLSEEEIKEITEELERRKKRCERFGLELSDNDKKLERALRFGELVEVYGLIKKNQSKPEPKPKHNQNNNKKIHNNNRSSSFERHHNNNQNRSKKHHSKPYSTNNNDIKATILNSVDKEILKRRVEKFGKVNSNIDKIILSKEEQEKRQQRSERFGN